MSDLSSGTNISDSLFAINPEARVPDEYNRRRIAWWYWVATIIPLGLTWLLLSLDYLGEPRDVGFFKNDKNLAWPTKSSSVPSIAVFLMYFLLPVLFIIGYNIYVGVKMSDQRLNICLNQVFILILVHACNDLLTNSLKFLVGRHRPDYLARCVPDYTIPGAQVDPDTGYVSNPSVVCTSPHLQGIVDGRKSFPSGHSSISTTGAVFFGLYLYRCFRRGPILGNAVPLAAAFIVISSALVVAASRISDNKHNPSDAIIGVMIGAFFGTLPYFIVPEYFLPILFPTSFDNTKSI